MLGFVERRRNEEQLVWLRKEWLCSANGGLCATVTLGQNLHDKSHSVVTCRYQHHDSRGQSDPRCILYIVFIRHMGCSLSTEPRARGKLIFFTTLPLCRTQCLSCKTMYQGVLKDDERRKEKQKKREADLQESLRKRGEYERVQTVRPS